MNKQEMKEMIILTVKEAIGNNASFSGEMLVLESNDVDHIAEESAERLLESGYINGADFVEWLKQNLYYDHITACYVINEEDIDKALQEYLKGE